MADRRQRQAMAAGDVLAAAALIRAQREVAALRDVFRARTNPADALTVTIAFTVPPTTCAMPASLPRAVADRLLDVAIATISADLNALGIAEDEGDG